MSNNKKMRMNLVYLVRFFATLLFNIYERSIVDESKV